MTYPKARITRSRSRSRNLRKKHLVKSKRINRSRKTKKTHSRKYRGGDSAVAAESIEAIIADGKAKVVPQETNFATSFLPATIKKINTFLTHSKPGEPPTFIGSSSEGAVWHFLYRSENRGDFLVYNEHARMETSVYYLKGWMIDAIKTQEQVEEEEE